MSKVATNSTVVTVNSTVGKSTVINGTAVDENAVVLAGVTLTVSVNGVSYSVLTDGVGFWSLTYVPSVVGSLVVEVNWVGNATHNGFTNSTLLNVSKVATNSTINVSGSTVGKNITINGIAIDENGNPLAGVLLNITINGTIHTVTTNSAGFWNLTYVPASSGILTIQASYLGNSTHFGFINSTDFNVANISANSTIVTVNSTVGKSTTINGTAVDSDGVVLAGVTLTVRVNGVAYTVTTNSAGYWSLTYIPSVVSSLAVEVNWTGNSTHNGFTNSTLLNVSKVASNSTVVAVNSTVGKTTTINGTAIDDNGNPLAGVTLTVTVDGISYTVLTNGVGFWSLTYIPSVAGSLVVEVRWAGNSTHNGFINTTSFNVAKAATNSTIVVFDTSVGESTVINGTAMDENGNVLAGVTLNVNVNGVVYTVLTNGVGFWSLTYTPMVEGLFNLTVSWDGNSTHNGFINSTVFSVPKIPANTTINAPDTKAKQSINITGVATDEKGNPLANSELTITINGRNFTVTTDITGAWSLTYTPPYSGVFNVIVSYAGNNTHLSFINSTSFIVAKLNTSITINAPINATVGKETTISGTLTDELGNLIANADLEITIDGESFIVTTNNVGVWILKYTPKNSGTIIVSAKYNGNETYIGSTNSTRFNVEESPIFIPNPTPKPSPKPNPIIKPDPKPNNLTNNTTNKTSNKPAVTAAMKNTGIPIIAILLVILSVLGIIIGKKQN